MDAWKQVLAGVITEEREAQLMSKRALARKLGVAPNYVVQWEQGKGIKDENVLLVEWGLGLEPGEIFTRAAQRMRPTVEDYGAAASAVTIRYLDTAFGQGVRHLEVVASMPDPALPWAS